MKIQNFAFSLSDLVVSVGTKVIWTNLDAVPHNVISDGGNGPLQSANLGTNETYAYTFEAAGNHPYSCTLHMGMAGSVTVQ